MAPEAVPCVFLAEPTPQRYITPHATEEIKLDGYRALAIKSQGRLNLVSKRRNSFNTQYPLVFEALADLPDNTVTDGEVVALNQSGRPDFNLLQHYRTEALRIHYFVFDLLIYDNRDLRRHCNLPRDKGVGSPG